MKERKTKQTYTVELLDVSAMSYAARLTAASLQGLVNREGPRLFLDFGIYDDSSARKTNEDFLPDELWHGKYREVVGYIDRGNLDYYKSVYTMEIADAPDLPTLIKKYEHLLRGAVVWDPELPETINVALMLGALESRLVIHPEMCEDLLSETALTVKEDLRGRWRERVELYQWAFENLFPRCEPGKVASYEPGWQRAEFADYIVQNRIFAYSLSAFKKDRLFTCGQMLLLMLMGGPFFLRNLIFNLRLDGPLKRAALALMGLRSRETALATRIQRAVKGGRCPTIFGWHCRRDDELAFMAHLSANGLRLVPSHLASNFSFHSRLECRVDFKQDHAAAADTALDESKIYLTFTLSDGDQLVLMNSAELGNWNLPERGQVPFNWEVQPLLYELAPALLGRYFDTLTPRDYLIAGPSGAGYLIPPLAPRLGDYLEESAKVCSRADICVATSYIGDPPLRVVREHSAKKGRFIGYLAGYFHFGRTPAYLYKGFPFVANKIPVVEEIAADCSGVFKAVRRLIESGEPAPQFIGVHLLAYRTTVADVHGFVQSLDRSRVKVVRADEFLLAAARHMGGS